MKLKIAGIDYDVVHMPSEAIGGPLGLADFNRQRIMINNDHTAATQTIALYHEIIHIVSDAWGLKLNEEQVKIGTHALISFMKDNPDFLEAINDR
jgi:hypothetical protein